MKTIGVLAFQGDFECHLKKLAACGAAGVEVRDLDTLFGTDALIIPGVRAPRF